MYSSIIIPRSLVTSMPHLEELQNFKDEIAPCRTFVFLHELEYLAKNNLIKGGDVDNAIVIVDRQMEQEELDRLAELFNKPKVKVQPEGILNNVDLRFSNEPARHKLLDLMGDLALVGRWFKAKIIATRPGHQSNNEFARALRQVMKKAALQKRVPGLQSQYGTPAGYQRGEKRDCPTVIPSCWWTR